MEQRKPPQAHGPSALSDLLGAFPHFTGLEPEAARVLAQTGRTLTIPTGRALFHDGDPSTSFVFVLKGAIRVQKVAENGREILLYRVEPGESCVMTTACLIGGSLYAAEGVTEGEVVAVTLPATAFRSLLALSECFRNFVFSAYASRISDLFMLIEDVAFGRIDMRLADWLVGRAESDRIRATHQDIAAELGTSREVVSRQLKEFERRGWVALHRGSLVIRDPTALTALAAGV